MTHTKTMLRALGLAAALTTMNGIAHAERVQATDPAQGDGRVTPFYRWTGEIPAHGKLLRSEPLPAELGLQNAASQLRILYASIDGVGGQRPVTVSGALFLPKGTPPKGGWPVVSWGHGTVGIADVCAPSWQGRSYRDVKYLNAWLAEGFAVVASDYQGLGTPGGHPLLNNRAAAYGILDAAHAVIAGTPGLSNRVIIVGQSQGGAGAVAAAGYAPVYTPDLGVKATVATGVIYRDPKAKPQSTPAKDDVVDPTIAYGFFSIYSAQLHDPSVDPKAVFSDLALPLVEQARSTCLFALEGDVTWLGLTRNNSSRPGGAAVTNAWFAKAVTYPTLRLAQPLFVGGGEIDGSTTADSQVAIARAAADQGSIVEAHIYAGLDHSGAVNASLRDSLPFVRRVLAGEKITTSIDAKPS